MTLDEFRTLVRNVRRIRLTPNTWYPASGPVTHIHIELDTWLFITEDGRGLYECDHGLLGRQQMRDSEFSLQRIPLSTEAERAKARKFVRAMLMRWLKKQDEGQQ